MARIDYLPVNSMENAVENAINYCEQQRNNKSENKSEKTSQFKELDRVWFKANESTIWVIAIDKKVKYAIPAHIAVLDLATQGKTLFEGLTEEAKQMLANTTAINRFEVSKDVLSDVFNASKKSVNASIEKVYQVF